MSSIIERHPLPAITQRTDAEILDWMQREGLESIVRCPQFNRKGEAFGISLWTSHWTPGRHFVSMRGAAMAAMDESERARKQGKLETLP